MQDPFTAVKRDVVNAMTKLDALYVKWRDTNDSTGAQKKKIMDAIKTIESDIGDLGEAINVVLANRAKFENVSDQEVFARKEFIDTTKSRLEQLKTDVADIERKKAIKEEAQPPKKQNAGRTKQNYKELQEEQDTDKFVDGHMQAQQEMLEDQDETLDDLTVAVKKLKVTGVEIQAELKVHDELLDDLGGEMDTLQGKMKNAQRQLTKALNEANKNTQICCIAVLVGILMAIIVLFFLF
uniref:t-SNARE coiled-coil homology domain-containing protein n=1 Tax=Eutreptiella gymnastica TaxID=73025 RepID=A0A7S1IK30_9EUGL|mmetsp:Transcript_23298/g.42013  ORF Transcript_23298/g.42013 Transcript_23298/m.42013 type:complete len:239 (+) Transcript_23298:61-777(+)